MLETELIPVIKEIAQKPRKKKKGVREKKLRRQGTERECSMGGAGRMNMNPEMMYRQQSAAGQKSRSRDTTARVKQNGTAGPQ